MSVERGETPSRNPVGVTSTTATKYVHTPRLRLRLSGAMTYNSEPLTETWHYAYLSVLRVTL